jgi:FKBP-type peptidyl-prolyl cis-trans isomerase
VIAITPDKKLTKVVLTSGRGPKPLRGQKATVHYTGRLTNGTVFDSSLPKNKEFQFQVGKGVISGWSIGVQTMKVGEKAQFTLAPEYGYGARGAPPSIPPNATLIFDIELLRVSK